MEDIQIKSELIEQLIEISKDAGKAIMEVYNSNFRHQILLNFDKIRPSVVNAHEISMNF